MPETTLIKSIILSLLPPGPLWEPEEGGDYDLFLDGYSESYESFRVLAESLAYIRDPQKTPILSDLEREFGILTDDRIDEEIRRNSLATLMYNRQGTGSRENLETALRDAGFDVYVHSNSPAVDPAQFIDSSFQMVCDQSTAVCGNEEAYCKSLGGYLIVNGKLFDQEVGYLMQCGGEESVCGNSDAVCGRFDFTVFIEKVYTIPADSAVWPFVFFIGGEATRDPVTDEITNIDFANIDALRRTEFENKILKYKPVHSWAALLINYI